MAFEHPLAGFQLVKGTIEEGESVEAAALRELAEESGIMGASVSRSLGTQPMNGQVWAFFDCKPTHILPESWVHEAPDDGGLLFRFFWHPLLKQADPSQWHSVFLDALSFIQNAA